MFFAPTEKERDMWVSGINYAIVSTSLVQALMKDDKNKEEKKKVLPKKKRCISQPPTSPFLLQEINQEFGEVIAESRQPEIVQKQTNTKNDEKIPKNLQEMTEKIKELEAKIEANKIAH